MMDLEVPKVVLDLLAHKDIEVLKDTLAILEVKAQQDIQVIEDHKVVKVLEDHKVELQALQVLKAPKVVGEDKVAKVVGVLKDILHLMLLKVLEDHKVELPVLLDIGALKDTLVLLEVRV
jgi:thioredoxin reductase